MLALLYCIEPQPLGLKMRSVEAGNFASLLAGRRGRATSSPLQLGHCPASTPLAHDSQNVHSNEQMRAPVESGARSRLQHSQFGLSCSIARLVLLSNASLRKLLADESSSTPRIGARCDSK